MPDFERDLLVLFPLAGFFVRDRFARARVEHGALELHEPARDVGDREISLLRRAPLDREKLRMGLENPRERLLDLGLVRLDRHVVDRKARVVAGLDRGPNVDVRAKRERFPILESEVFDAGPPERLNALFRDRATERVRDQVFEQLVSNLGGEPLSRDGLGNLSLPEARQVRAAGKIPRDALLRFLDFLGRNLDLEDPPRVGNLRVVQNRHRGHHNKRGKLARLAPEPERGGANAPAQEGRVARGETPFAARGAES